MSMAIPMAHDGSRIDGSFSGVLRPQTEGACRLSEREHQLVELIAQGLETKEIAGKLFVSANTVRSHLHSVFNKLHLSDRLELALWKVAPAVKTEAFGGPDHRKERRFLIRQQAHCRILDGPCAGATAAGWVLNFSNSGLWFLTDRQLSCRQPVRLWMDWPILLNGIRPLQLAIGGRVVRVSELGAALSIERWEFRTRPARGA